MSRSDTKTKKTLSPRQRKAIPILAAATSVAQAAQLSQVDRRTLHRWLVDDEFRAALREFEDQVAELARARIQALSIKAVSVLDELLESSNPDIRMKATRIAMTHSAKINEIRRLSEDLQNINNSLPLIKKSKGD